MHITLLGTGTPTPLPHRMGPATLVTIGEQHLLFDAGRGVITQLVRAGVALERLGRSSSPTTTTTTSAISATCCSRPGTRAIRRRCA
jgi:ribonuclease BN (tRNA processing enzyme)